MTESIIYPLHRYTITGRSTSHVAIYKRSKKSDDNKKHEYTQEERYMWAKNKIIYMVEAIKPEVGPTHFFSLLYKPKIGRIDSTNFDLDLMSTYNKAFFRGIQRFYPNSWFLRTFDLGKKNIIHNHGVCYLNTSDKLKTIQENFLFMWQQVTDNERENICTVSEYERGREFYLTKEEKKEKHFMLCHILGNKHFFSLYNRNIMEFCEKKSVLLDNEENEAFLSRYENHIVSRGKSWNSYKKQLCSHQHGRVCDTEENDMLTMMMEAKRIMARSRKMEDLADKAVDMKMHPSFYNSGLFDFS